MCDASLHSRCVWILTRSLAAFSAATLAAGVGVGLLSWPLAPLVAASTSLATSSADSSLTLSAVCFSDLAPSNLAIAGVVGDAAGALLANIVIATSGASVIAPAREAHTLALAAEAEIRAAIKSGGLTPQRAAALDVARTRLDAARITLDGAEHGLRDLAIAALIDRVGAENAALAQRAASHLSRRVPEAWKVLDLPPDSPMWSTLESAWFKAQRGLPDTAFTQAERDALAAAQSDPTVALAQQRLDANLAGVEAAWAQFIAEQMAEPQPPM